MKPPKGLKGGQKHKLLEESREDILKYLADHGEGSTRDKYNIVSNLTWYNFIHHTPKPRKKLSPTDKLKAELEITREDVKDIKQELISLKADYSRLVDKVSEAIAKRLSLALFVDDPDSVDNFIGELKK